MHPAPVTVPLVEVARGPIVEARHRGVIVVASPRGEILASLGDGALVTSTRSTIKPIQALPFVLSGAADRFGVTARELALVCASHSGEDQHTDAVTRLMRRADLGEQDLLCGPHEPMHKPSADALTRAGASPRPIHNNCSGKHTGMLLTCRHHQWPTERYVDPEHPLQRRIRDTLARLCGLDAITAIGVDGCSAPTFGVPVRALALAAARLANPTALADAPLSAAIARVTSAMTAHPEMVGGTGRFDTELMEAAGGALACKIGAESVYSVMIFPCAAFPEGAGVAVKIADGAQRALNVVVVETLRQLGVLGRDPLRWLERFHKPRVRNCRALEVGALRPAFHLER